MEKETRKEIIKWIADEYPRLDKHSVTSFNIEKESRKIAVYSTLQKEIEGMNIVEMTNYLEELKNEGDPLREKMQYDKYIENRKKYKAQKKSDIERGEKFKKQIKPGMLIRVKGTRDGIGLRVVMEVNESEVTCRKVSIRRIENIKTIVGEKYITTHGWDKVVKIIQEDVKLDVIV
jgi:hypothetical protein